MKRFLALTLMLACLLGCACAQEVSAAPATITATGVSRLTVPADYALLTLYLSGEGETVADAQLQAETMQASVMEALTAAGVAQEDIRTAYWDVEALYNYHYTKLTETQVVTGYSVQTHVEALIHDVGSVGAVVAAVVGGDAGVSYEISFQSTQKEAAYAQALAAAAQDAVAKAGQLAQSCGLTLEKLLSVTEIAPQAQENALTVEAAVEVAYSVQ